MLDKEGNEIPIKALTTIEKVLPKTGLYASDYGYSILIENLNANGLKA